MRAALAAVLLAIAPWAVALEKGSDPLFDKAVSDFYAAEVRPMAYAVVTERENALHLLQEKARTKDGRTSDPAVLEIARSVHAELRRSILDGSLSEARLRALHASVTADPDERTKALQDEVAAIRKKTETAPAPSAAETDAEAATEEERRKAAAQKAGPKP